MKFSIKELKEQLQHGDITAIATELHISKAAVSDNLSGKYKSVNTRVIEATIKRIKVRRALEKRIQKQVNHLKN